MGNLRVHMFIIGFKSWLSWCIYTEAKGPVSKASGQPSWPPCEQSILRQCFWQLDVYLARLEHAHLVTKASITRCKDDVASVDLEDRKQMRVTWR